MNRQSSQLPSSFAAVSAPVRLRAFGRESFTQNVIRRNGFTLIEILATLLLMGIALVAINGAFAAVRSAATNAQQRAKAHDLAQSKLNELVAMAPSAALGGSSTAGFTLASSNGDFGTLAPGYTWTAEINAWGQDVGANASNMVQELDVHVQWRTGNRQQQVTASTLVYQSANTSSTSSGTVSGGVQ